MRKSKTYIQKNMLLFSLITLAALLPAKNASTENKEKAENLAGLFRESVFTGYLRPRYEFVEQDSLANHANAYTMASRFSIESASYKNFSGLVEVENISSLAEETFNNTVNGKTDYPVVADPECSEFNRVYIQYSSAEAIKILYGRRTINLDNQRFIGEVAWRQNNQTFDGADLSFKLSENLKADYYYINQVNRVFGEDSLQDIYDSESHLFHSDYNIDRDKKASLYSYLLNLENSDNLSSASSGARLQSVFSVDNSQLKIQLDLSYAYQNEYADNPDTFDNQYFAAETGIIYGSNKIKIGYESLGSDGKFSFQTPLATLHAFDGWADMFLKTPEKGLSDTYLFYSLDTEPWSVFKKGSRIETALHHFSAEYGNLNYGQELNFAVINQLSENHSIALHYANYSSDNLYSDTQKFWFSITSKISVS